MRIILQQLAALAIAVLLLCGTAHAQVPQTVSYQGILADTTRRPVPNGVYALTISIYVAPVGGAALWSEVHPTVPVIGGLFDMTLGSITPLMLPFNAPYYLGVSVNGGAEMTPRTAFTAAPYSYWSKWADSAKAVPVNSISTGNIVNGAVTNQKLSAVGSTAGQVLVSAGDSVIWGGGTGVTSLNGQKGDLTIVGAGGTTVTRAGSTFTIKGSSGVTSINSIDAAIAITDPTGPAVTLSIVPGGISEPLISDEAITTQKIRAMAVTPSKINSSGAGAGQALIYTGTNVVWGNPIAAGLLLPFSGTLNDPSPGISIDNTGTGMGIYAIHSASNGTAPGMRGETNSTDASANGVVGSVNPVAPGGFSSGVRGINNGTGGLGIGVYGSQAGSGWGVYGTTPSGIGVNGNSTSGFGLYGQSNSGTGVYGLSSTGAAGIFEITNVASSADALTGMTAGTGRAGNFAVSNAASTADAMNVTTAGTGRAILGRRGAGSGLILAQNAAIRGDNTDGPGVSGTSNTAVGVYGTSTTTHGVWGVGLTAGSAGVEGRNDVVNGYGVEGVSVGGGVGVRGTSQTGNAGMFDITNAASTADALNVTTAGTGRAGRFAVTNAASTANGVEVTTAGTGRAMLGRRGAGSGVVLGQTEAIRGDNTDGPGVAGTSNTAVGLYGTSTASNGVWGVSVTAATAGVLGRNDVVNGYGVWGQSAGGAIGVYGTSQTGNAGQFDITNAASTADAVRANQAGTGRGVYAQITNAANIVAAVRGETNGSGYGIFGQATGNGNAGFFQISNPASTSSAVSVTTNGIGSGVTVQLTNASNGARGIDVLQAGVGPGVFATSAGGNAVWGITSSISAAGVIGDNTFGEAVVGRNRGGNGVGAVVGRNDSSGYGVRGFNTKDGIGVLGQTGISGGTGVGGRFENVNAANSNDALQAATNGTGWAINATNANNSSASKGVRIVTTAGQGGNALTVANGTIAFSTQHPYASGSLIDDAHLVVTTAGNVTVPTGAPLVDGAHVFVVNNAGAVVTVTNTTVGAFNINPGRACEFIFISTVSGANWIPVQP